MYNDLILIALAVVAAGFPWLILRGYQAEPIPPEQYKLFTTFQWLEDIWGLFVCVYLLVGFLVQGRLQPWSILAFLLASVTFPEACLAGMLGVYRKSRHRGVVDIYVRKGKTRPFVAGSRIPVLQMVGWIQLAALLGVIIAAFMRM